MPTIYYTKKGNIKWRGFYTNINGERGSKSFATKEEAIKWETIHKNHVKQYKDKKRAEKAIERAEKAKERAKEKVRINNSKTPEQRRKENLEKNGNNSQTEAIATIKFCELLKDTYDFIQIRDGAHNDLALQFKSKKSNKYYALQIKSCNKRYKPDYLLKDESLNNTTPRARFGGVNKYPNSILVCILLKPFTIWIYHGNQFINHNKTLIESKEDKFQNGLIYNEEKNINHLDKLEEYLTCINKNGQDKYAQKEIEFWDSQLNASTYIEHRANQLYQQHMNKRFERRKIGEIENQHHDLIEDGKKIQEKVCCVIKNKRSGFHVNIVKSGGRNLTDKCTQIPYEEKDFDILRVYVLYIFDKNNKLSFKRENYKIGYDQNDEKYVNAIKDIDSWKLFGYFEFPMDILIKKDWIHTESSKGKTCIKIHLPKEIMQSFGLKLPREDRQFINGWTREYFKKIY